MNQPIEEWTLSMFKMNLLSIVVLALNSVSVINLSSLPMLHACVCF